MDTPNTEDFKRKEMSAFLAETREYWAVLGFLSVDAGSTSLPQILGSKLVLGVVLSGHKSRQKTWRISVYDACDYAIRPRNPAIIEGGPPMKFSVDDARLSDPRLQYIPGGDGEVNNPPKRYQLLELDQSWIIAVRFEIEPLIV